MASPSSDWSDSNLRRRSFYRQNLAGVNFQGSDLRGCDFTGANLTGANLAQAKIGRAPEALVWSLLLLLGTGAIVFYALSQLIFGILGLTSDDPTYSLSVALRSLLAISGLMMGSVAVGRWRYPLIWTVAILQGALLGFWGGGIASNFELWSAVGGGMAGAAIFWAGVYFAQPKGFGVVIATLGVAMVNGMFFIAGVQALQLIVVRQFGMALVWMMVALLYWLILLRTVGYLYGECCRMSATRFTQADLSYVRWK
ncbi:MAG: pentapeptide repeat-containing protein [Cyanobacteria bacterium P01_F01_bin.42]